MILLKGPSPCVLDRNGSVLQAYKVVCLKCSCHCVGTRHGQSRCWEIQHATQQAVLHLDLHGI